MQEGWKSGSWKLEAGIKSESRRFKSDWQELRTGFMRVMLRHNHDFRFLQRRMNAMRMIVTEATPPDKVI
jgi:hypothetical protein